VVSGLYLSRPFKMASICSGLSGAKSNATPIAKRVMSLSSWYGVAHTRKLYGWCKIGLKFCDLAERLGFKVTIGHR
jgi:hypothetical protein